MAAIKDTRTIGGPNSNERAVYKVVYDVAKDSPSAAAIDLITAGEAIVVTGFRTKVLAAVTATGSATIKVGPTGDDDKFMTIVQGAKANLTLGAMVVPPIVVSGDAESAVPPLPWQMAAGDKIIQTIGTDALLTGKIEYTIEVEKF